MAYMNQEKKAKIAAAIKPLLKKYGIKATLAVRNHMTIALNIKAGSIDFIDNYVNTVRQLHGRTPNEDSLKYMVEKQYLDVNPYWFHEHFSGVAKKFLEEAMMALKGAGWYDRSDIQSDYFDTAYYVDINIGQWNKPYQVV
jgi:hypothetical protein